LPEEPLPEEPLPEEPLPEALLPEEPLPEELLPEEPLPEELLPEELPPPEPFRPDVPLPDAPALCVDPVPLVVALAFPPPAVSLTTAPGLPSHDCVSDPSLEPPPQAESTTAANAAAHNVPLNRFILICFLVSNMAGLTPDRRHRLAQARAAAPRLCR
ncbi:hypothetical protein ACFFG2_14025, partial [Paraburkholderia solisilvae]